MSNPKKIVVFDLDETLGNFVELGMFCDALSAYNQQEIRDEEFYELLDIFPEFLRPNIISILKYLLKKRETGECSKIMIYTNNQGPRSWFSKTTATIHRESDCKFRRGTGNHRTVRNRKDLVTENDRRPSDATIRISSGL